MMIPHSVVQSYSMLRGRLNDQALVELDRLMTSVQPQPQTVQREALMDLLPTLGEQYVGASSLISAQFFEELQEMNEVRKPVQPEILDGLGHKSWHALVGWAFSGSQGGNVLEQAGSALVYSLLSGGLTKRLTEASADTMIGNAEIQGGMRSQRVPKAGCCAFCAMLASRFAEYSSESSAGQVVGRGVPVGQGKGRGSFGKGRGIKARGARALGEDFHDYCRCEIVVVTEKNYVELQQGAEKYYKAYRDAADKVNSGLTLRSTDISSSERLKNKYEWVDASGVARGAKQRTGDILTHMRSELGVK